MKIEPIIHLENSLKQDEYKQKKKMIKKRNKDFKNYLQVEVDKEDMYDEERQE